MYFALETLGIKQTYVLYMILRYTYLPCSEGTCCVVLIFKPLQVHSVLTVGNYLSLSVFERDSPEGRGESGLFTIIPSHGVAIGRFTCVDTRHPNEMSRLLPCLSYLKSIAIIISIRISVLCLTH